MKRRNMLMAPAIVAGALIWSSALLAQDPEMEDSPQGAWFAWATIEGFPRQIPFMDTYTSDAQNQGRSGTVFCTLSVGKFVSPMGEVGVTPSAQGNWVRIAKNTFAFTAWRILVDADGRPVGTAKFWGTVSMQGTDSFTGTMNMAFYAPDGSRFGGFKGTTAAKRISIEMEEQ